ncbi:MAG: S8 family peptidase [Aureispira sp.]
MNLLQQSLLSRLCFGVLFIALLAQSSSTQGQSPSKVNTALFRLLEETPLVQQDSIELPVLIKGDLTQLVKWVEEEGGHYKYGVKDIASVTISLRGIAHLLERQGITRIVFEPADAYFLDHEDDSLMLVNNRVQPVFQGAAPFPKAFRGTGVLLGVIDDGFEWQHPDFWLADSSTRILGLWDQNSTDSRYFQSYYSYGAEWTKADIDAYQCTHTALDHGSHVMGTAGGNAFATQKYRGIAPEADLAAVGIVLEGSFLSSFVDGLHYLFDKATVLGQPCVVNSSVGSYGSGHDGKDLYAQLVAQLLQAQPGRVLVQAGGNARQANLHLGVTLQNDTALTAFAYHQAARKTHFTCYADTGAWSGVEFDLELLHPQTGQHLAQTRTFQVHRDFVLNGGVGHWSELLFLDAQGQEVRLDIYVDQYEDAYATTIEISSASNLGHWQLRTMGTGQYDIWSDEPHLRTSNMVRRSIPKYQAPDNVQTIVGFWTCAAPVVVVGSYQNRQYIVNYTQDTVDIGTAAYPVGEISQFSSLGPTRTGLQKPDLTAPGGQVMSAASLSTLQYQRGLNFSNRLDADGWHWLNRGTSMAAPMVAGAVALFLECQPYANSSQVLQALQQSAQVDAAVLTQTVTWPNIHWGYGKLEVTQLMGHCLVRGCMDSTALNFDPLATLPDSNACQYGLSVLTRSSKNTWRCYPNPMTQAAQIAYELEQEGGQFILYNALGQVVWTKALTNTRGHLVLERKKLPAGCYTLFLQQQKGNNQLATSGQFIVILP